MAKAKKSMKKVRKSNKKSASKSSNRLVYITLAVFVLALVVLPAINVSQNSTITGYAAEEDKNKKQSFISDLFSEWEGGDLDVNVAKYLFFGMLAMLIFVVLNGTGVINNVALQWLFAIPIAFLSTAYITPAEVFSILTTYTALGLTFAVLIPFMILMLGSAFILSPYDKNGRVKPVTIGQVLMVQTVWVGFLVFLTYKIFSGFGEGFTNFSKGMNVGIMIVYGTFLVSLIIVLANKRFRNWVRKIGYELKRAEAEAIGVATTTAADLSQAVAETGVNAVNVGNELRASAMGKESPSNGGTGIFRSKRKPKFGRFGEGI